MMKKMMKVTLASFTRCPRAVLAFMLCLIQFSGAMDFPLPDLYPVTLGNAYKENNGRLRKFKLSSQNLIKYYTMGDQYLGQISATHVMEIRDGKIHFITEEDKEGASTHRQLRFQYPAYLKRFKGRYDKYKNKEVAARSATRLAVSTRFPGVKAPATADRGSNQGKASKESSGKLDALVVQPLKCCTQHKVMRNPNLFPKDLGSAKKEGHGFINTGLKTRTFKLNADYTVKYYDGPKLKGTIPASYSLIVCDDDVYFKLLTSSLLNRYYQEHDNEPPKAYALSSLNPHFIEKYHEGRKLLHKQLREKCKQKLLDWGELILDGLTEEKVNMMIRACRRFSRTSRAFAHEMQENEDLKTTVGFDEELIAGMYAIAAHNRWANLNTGKWKSNWRKMEGVARSIIQVQRA